MIPYLWLNILYLCVKGYLYHLVTKFSLDQSKSSALATSCWSQLTVEMSSSTENQTETTTLPPNQNGKGKEDTNNPTTKGAEKTFTFLGVEFAPLSIPLKRRLQTLGILHFTISFFCGFLVLAFTVYLLFTSFYWIPLLYTVWFFLDRNTPSRGGRRSAWLRNWPSWRWMRDYFPIELVKTSDLDPKHNYLLGYHPHGILGNGTFVNFATEATGFSHKFPGITPYTMTLAGQFLFPFYRDYIMAAGLVPVSRDCIDYLLTQQGTGNAIVIVVGGAVESLEAHPGSSVLVLRNRKGFVKQALKKGAHLVPIYSFGEVDIYTQIPNPQGSWIKSFQKRMTKILGFAIPFFHGRGIFNYSFGLIPYRKPIHTVVGKPIPVEQVAEPTDQQVNELHQRYMDSLEELFNQNKDKYGYGHQKIIFISSKDIEK